jgi:ribosomal protein S18 acetylase RimI-like enzyme
MGFFTQAVEKFAGFAGEKAAAKGLSAVPEEAAAFIKSLDAAEGAKELAVKFEASGPAWERTLKMTADGKFAGHLGFKIDPHGQAQIYGTVVSKEFRGQKLGVKMYKQAIEEAMQAGAKSIASDPTHITDEASHVWGALKRRGFNVQEFEYRPGYKGFKIDLEHAKAATEEIMKAGAGNDATSLLNRSLRTTGSRRMTGAL